MKLNPMKVKSAVMTACWKRWRQLKANREEVVSVEEGGQQKEEEVRTAVCGVS